MDTIRPVLPPAQNEQELVADVNHCPPPLPPKFILDPINVYDVNGAFVGYSWNYGDSVQLVLDLNNTILHSNPDYIELYEVFLDGKLVEINFIDIRGHIKYTFYEEAKIFTKIKLNTTEENLIERNTYKMTLVLVDPVTSDRVNLLMKPYEVYVK